MLDRRTIATEEERLRALAAELDGPRRAAFHREAARRLRDPDTYAVLNWFFLVGLHHFYLGRWWRGSLDVGLFGGGMALLVMGEVLGGVALIVLVAAMELWALFRAQIIVDDWNNRILRRLLSEYGVTAADPARDEPY